MESIFKLGILLTIVDKVTGPTGQIGKSMDALKGKATSLGPTFDKFATYGSRVAGAGALMIAMLMGTVMATAGTQKALGELSSVGVTDMAAMETAAMQFSNQWAGTTKADFIAAAYDIKSGISTLSDTGVAEFTKLAALTGKATKSTTAEMTSLFATGYGIYKDMYGNLSDLQFGEVFSAGIAGSVKAFKTTGSGMAQAISTLGATATSAKVPLEEQLSILGMLQATMSGSEAGTKYKALMQAAAGAGEKLKLPLVDANNQLLSMPVILDKLRGKYGTTLDAMEKIEIQKAFGTQEAVAVIDLLYGKVGDLTGNIKSLSTAMGQGTSFTEQMALAMNQDIGAGIQLLGQRLHNVMEVIGKQLIPILAPFFAVIGNGMRVVGEFAEKHATLTKVIVVAAAIIAVLTFVLGGLAAIFGVIGLAVPAVVAGFAMVTGAFIPATVAAWSFTAALLANPLTWIVIAIIAVAAGLYYLYKRFEVVRNVVDKFMFILGYVIGTIWKFKSVVLLMMLGPIGMIIGGFKLLKRALSGVNLFESGAKILQTLVAGIKSKAMAVVESVTGVFKKVRNLLPFSDAKEGPLSQLTLSGARIMDTMGAGITGAAPGLHRSMAKALAGAALTASVATSPQAAAAQGKKIVIQKVEVHISSVADANDFVRQLQQMAEGYDE